MGRTGSFDVERDPALGPSLAQCPLAATHSPSSTFVTLLSVCVCLQISPFYKDAGHMGPALMTRCNLIPLIKALPPGTGTF